VKIKLPKNWKKPAKRTGYNEIPTKWFLGKEIFIIVMGGMNPHNWNKMEPKILMNELKELKLCHNVTNAALLKHLADALAEIAVIRPDRRRVRRFLFRKHYTKLYNLS